MKLKLSKRVWVVTPYLLVFLAYSASNNFLFFVDSNTYFNAIVYVPLLSEITKVHPYGALMVSVVNLSIILWVIEKYKYNIFSLFLLTPYNLLLLTNVTKESILFLASFFLYYIYRDYKNKKMKISALLIGYALSVVRPVYLILMLGSVRARYLLFLSVMVIVVLVNMGDVGELLGGVSERLSDKESVRHTGRDFFNYLCVSEKASFYDFIACWIPVLVLAPYHEDLLSVNYIIYLLFQFPFIYLVYELVRRKGGVYVKIGLIAIFMHFVVFYASPTFGAFVRYGHPIVWSMGFVYLSIISIRNYKK